MRIALSLLLLLAAAPMFGAAPEGFAVWPKGVNPGKAAAKFSNHSLAVSHRDKSGIPEVHQKVADIFVVQSGSAVLLIGTDVADAKAESPGELRGGSIKNGTRHKLAAGDVVHIPAGVAHQFFLDAGKEITYFVVKVEGQ
jgi:mannose-6-phosphate isomerase-like protein (cupin superfamily)